MRRKWWPILVVVLLAVSACVGGPPSEFVQEKMAELGAKDVILFDTRKRAVDALIRECLGADAETVDKIACIQLSLEVVDPPKSLLGIPIIDTAGKILGFQQ